LVGHSMGGLAALFAGINDRMMFDRIFLSAPMLALDRQPLSMKGMARVTAALSFLGLGQLPISRKADQPASAASFANNPLTGDMVRYLRSVDVVKARPDLEIAAPTIRWAASAFGAMAEAGEDNFPARIRVPLLML